jgi:hypothetical protein
MGLFSKKKSTKEENFQETVVEHKIVKLSYLQTLAVTGGITNANELAGETEARNETIKNGKSSNKLPFFADDPLTRLAKKFDPLGGAVLNGLFGKKVSREVTQTVKDSGWKVVKTWLQPEFDKIRYAIGIRELSFAQFRYEKVSEVVSKPWSSPKDISKVTLIVDEFIPPQFEPGPAYIEYYIKPEIENQDWIRINPIGARTIYNDKGNIVPRIINFNTEKPVNSRIEDAYINTKEQIKSIRFRAVLMRPDTVTESDTSADSYTPILKSYRLALFPRGGL